MPVSEYVRNESSTWNLLHMFKENYCYPATLAELGVKDDTMERIAAALQSVWENSAPTQPSGDVPICARAELQQSRRPESAAAQGRSVHDGLTAYA
eukprot:1562773-Rhodomonas_salina.2